MKTAFEGAIFDFDGVIVDSHPIHKRAWRKFLRSIGKAASEEELQFVLDGRRRDDILRHFLGELDGEKLAEYGHRKEKFFRDESDNVRTITGLRGFLADLRKSELPLGIASSGSRARVEFLLERLRLKHYFEVIITGDDVSEGKPHPAVFLKAAQLLKKHPCALIAFEDAVSGVRAARSAGMTCVGVAQHGRAAILLEAGANNVVPDFRLLNHKRLKLMFGRAALAPGNLSPALRAVNVPLTVNNAEEAS